MKSGRKCNKEMIRVLRPAAAFHRKTYKTPTRDRSVMPDHIVLSYNACSRRSKGDVPQLDLYITHSSRSVRNI